LKQTELDLLFEVILHLKYNDGLVILRYNYTWRDVIVNGQEKTVLILHLGNIWKYRHSDVIAGLQITLANPIDLMYVYFKRHLIKGAIKFTVIRP